MKEIWVEKYRPVVLQDVAGQPTVTESLAAYVRTGSIPHLLFAGPAGTGKTTCALIIAREIYGDSWRDNFKEMNASDERGIDVVRGKIKDFARTAPLSDATFKIIFLDEADALTSDAQAALRRTMERYTFTCRFILSCNYSSKIIEPIQSRCVMFRFTPLKERDIQEYITKICDAEKIDITKDGIQALVFISQGDMRKAINILQVTASISEQINDDVVYRVSSTARPEDMKRLLLRAIQGQFLPARSILDELFITGGLSGEDIIRGIHGAIMDLDISEEYKAELIERIGEAEFRLVEGSNDRIQIEAFLAHAALLGKKFSI
jgi:replication factor C small subunit